MHVCPGDPAQYFINSVLSRCHQNNGFGCTPPVMHQDFVNSAADGLTLLNLAIFTKILMPQNQMSLVTVHLKCIKSASFESSSHRPFSHGVIVPRWVRGGGTCPQIPMARLPPPPPAAATSPSQARRPQCRQPASSVLRWLCGCPAAPPMAPFCRRSLLPAEAATPSRIRQKRQSTG